MDEALNATEDELQGHRRQDNKAKVGRFRFASSSWAGTSRMLIKRSGSKCSSILASDSKTLEGKTQELVDGEMGRVLLWVLKPTILHHALKTMVLLRTRLATLELI